MKMNILHKLREMVKMHRVISNSIANGQILEGVYYSWKALNLCRREQANEIKSI